MILKTTDFEYGAYVPNRDDAPNSDIIGNEPVLQGFINKYVERALVETLGWELFSLLKAELDQNGDLPPTADQKWLDLVNGKEAYRGMKKGMLVGYVFFYFLQNDTVDYSTAGTNRVTPEGSQVERPDGKMNLQYREFYEQAIGTYYADPLVIEKEFGRYGVIWGGLSGSKYVSMYEFLRENTTTYPEWDPSLVIQSKNVFDI